MKNEYADGTYLEHHHYTGAFYSGRALCSDGVVRKLSRISPFSDTSFSIPAAVKVKGKSVSGFVLVETRDGFTNVVDVRPPAGTRSRFDAPAIVKFVAYSYRKNGDLLE